MQVAQERNPFADSASKLLRVALSSPAKAWGIRELSRMAQTSPALTILTLRQLQRVGLASRESPTEARFLDPVQLLRDWAAWYVMKQVKYYRFSISGVASPNAILKLLSKERAQLPGQWALTCMAGASLVAPFATFSEVHIHLPKAEQLRRSWQDVLRLTPDKLGPIHLIQPYYADSGSYGVQVIQKLPVVSAIQLYLDCYRYPVRGREQAEHILTQVLMPRWRNAR
ncbi:MAG: hypothetical protein A2V88_15735 [Elusimicrobia bacterium RBG_16_66_12]|nr:MAG: hypothetical protein A2V88_15735 [Elusimicrobia bacterium RBG_16_66_12]